MRDRFLTPVLCLTLVLYMRVENDINVENELLKFNKMYGTGGDFNDE